MKKFGILGVLVFLFVSSTLFAAPIPTFIAKYDDSSLTADYSRGSPTATFVASRDSTHPATYFDSSGVMQKTETADAARYTFGYYDDTGWNAFTTSGVMIESANTNYITHSIFDAGAGTATGWGITEDDSNDDTPSLVDVSGTFNVGTTVQAQRIQMTFSDGTYLLIGQKTGAGTFAQNDKVTISFWLKGTTSGVAVKTEGFEQDELNAIGTIHIGSDIVGSISSTEWRRFAYSFTAVDADCDHIYIRVIMREIDNGDTIDLQFACFQVEKSPFATSFIPTTTAVLTRNAETLKYETAGNRTASVESYIVKLSPEYDSSIDNPLQIIMATDIKRRFMRFRPSSNDARIMANLDDSPNSDIIDIINDSWTANTEMTLGYTMQSGTSPYIAGYYQGIADGTNETTDDFTANAWGTYWWLGSHTDGTLQLNGTIFSIAFWDIVLSDTWMSEIHTGGYGLTTIGGATLGGLTIQ